MQHHARNFRVNSRQEKNIRIFNDSRFRSSEDHGFFNLLIIQSFRENASGS